MTDTNSADKKRMYCEVCLFFGPLDSGNQNFESSVPKGHQHMNVFVGPCAAQSVSLFVTVVLKHLVKLQSSSVISYDPLLMDCLDSFI